MYSVQTTTKFRKDIKRCQKQGKNMDLFKAIDQKLMAEIALPEKNRDHLLTGNWKNCRECHILPDWLLIYRIDDDKKEIEYVRTGSHSELFNK